MCPARSQTTSSPAQKPNGQLCPLLHPPQKQIPNPSAQPAPAQKYRSSIEPIGLLLIPKGLRIVEFRDLIINRQRLGRSFPVNASNTFSRFTRHLVSGTPEFINSSPKAVAMITKPFDPEQNEGQRQNQNYFADAEVKKRKDRNIRRQAMHNWSLASQHASANVPMLIPLKNPPS